jgi:mycothiol synthase
MPHDRAGRIVLRPELTAADRAQLDALVAACGRHDGADWSFVAAMAAAYDGALPQPLAYDGDALVGVASLQGPDAALEVSGLVHPAHRRRGLGTALLGAVRAAGRGRGLPGALLTCDEAAPAGAAFARAAGAAYQSSEYRLAWSGPGAGAPGPGGGDGLERVTAATLPEFARVHAAAFGHDEARARAGFARSLARPGVALHLARLDGEAVGVVRTAVQDGEGWITALGVAPARRGRGLGRRLLLGAVAALRAAGARPILLEVATDNRAALRLYEACGFRQIGAYAYFHLAF